MPSPTDAGPVPIEEYAVLGDGESAALVSRRGSIDWMCLPRFDSDACFAALLGEREHGRWLVTVPEATTVERRYVGDTFVLETTYTTPKGVAVVREAMPGRDGRADLVRHVRCTSGEVDVVHELVVRFGYGKVVPWVSHARDADGVEVIRAIAGADSLTLHGTRLPRATGRTHVDHVRLSAGEELDLSLTWTPSWDPIPASLPIAQRYATAADGWTSWLRPADETVGRYADAARRSLLTLRLLTDDVTGGIVAAPTTSLPEDFGGERNWDYRFCWLRDAALTLEAFLDHGHVAEAARWRDWLVRAAAGDPQDLQIVYGLDGRRDLPERELDHLPGYAGSRPVRVGNAAVGQVQNDVLGEVMCALFEARSRGEATSAESWSLQSRLVDALVERWTLPDRGIWEVRGDAQHFVHSKVMVWAALDRAVRSVEEHGLPGPVERWRTTREEVRADVLAHGWDAKRGTFVQHYGAEHTDAALLQMVQVGFLEPQDPMFLGTVAAIRDELEVSPGLVHRYRTTRTDDGLLGDEHPFLACSFWLADALARADDVDGARDVLDRLVALRNDVGLLSEEYDVAGDRMAGNFPQALSHLALVRAVHQYDLAVARASSTTPPPLRPLTALSPASATPVPIEEPV